VAAAVVELVEQNEGGGMETATRADLPLNACLFLMVCYEGVITLRSVRICPSDAVTPKGRKTMESIRA
jgi:hypothetical protein